MLRGLLGVAVVVLAMEAGGCSVPIIGDLAPAITPTQRLALRKLRHDATRMTKR